MLRIQHIHPPCAILKPPHSSQPQEQHLCVVVSAPPSACNPGGLSLRFVALAWGEFTIFNVLRENMFQRSSTASAVGESATSAAAPDDHDELFASVLISIPPLPQMPDTDLAGVPIVILVLEPANQERERVVVDHAFFLALPQQANDSLNSLWGAMTEADTEEPREFSLEAALKACQDHTGTQITPSSLRCFKDHMQPMVQDLTGILYASRHLPLLQVQLMDKMISAGVQPTRPPPVGLQEGSTSQQPPQEPVHAVQPSITAAGQLAGTSSQQNEGRSVGLSFMLRPESSGPSMYESVVDTLSSASSSATSVRSSSNTSSADVSREHSIPHDSRHSPSTVLEETAVQLAQLSPSFAGRDRELYTQGVAETMTEILDLGIDVLPLIARVDQYLKAQPFEQSALLSLVVQCSFITQRAMEWMSEQIAASTLPPSPKPFPLQPPTPTDNTGARYQESPALYQPRGALAAPDLSSLFVQTLEPASAPQPLHQPATHASLPPPNLTYPLPPELVTPMTGFGERGLYRLGPHARTRRVESLLQLGQSQEASTAVREDVLTTRSSHEKWGRYLSDNLQTVVHGFDGDAGEGSTAAARMAEEDAFHAWLAEQNREALHLISAVQVLLAAAKIVGHRKTYGDALIVLHGLFPVALQLVAPFVPGNAFLLQMLSPWFDRPGIAPIAAQSRVLNFALVLEACWSFMLLVLQGATPQLRGMSQTDGHQRARLPPFTLLALQAVTHAITGQTPLRQAWPYLLLSSVCSAPALVQEASQGDLPPLKTVVWALCAAAISMITAIWKDVHSRKQYVADAVRRNDEMLFSMRARQMGGATNQVNPA